MSHVDVLRVERPCPAGISLMDGAGYGTCTTTLDAGYCLYCWFAPQERGFCIEHPTSALKCCRSCETAGGGSRRATPRRSSWPGTTPCTRAGKHMNEVRHVPLAPCPASLPPADVDLLVAAASSQRLPLSQRLPRHLHRGAFNGPTTKLLCINPTCRPRIWREGRARRPSSWAGADL